MVYLIRFINEKDKSPPPKPKIWQEMCHQKCLDVFCKLALKRRLLWILQNLPFQPQQYWIIWTIIKPKGDIYYLGGWEGTILHSKFFPLNVIIFSSKNIAVKIYFFYILPFKKFPSSISYSFAYPMRPLSLLRTPLMVRETKILEDCLHTSKIFLFLYILCVIDHKGYKAISHISQKINTSDLEILTSARFYIICTSYFLNK